ncbi:hypothetical protein LXA43DRAFT_1068101 [Ganoderma leucocontextum]|nr:hypothetical protein LXA43DRAFT_1068101 [Ganoderma leucocontextum]
MSRLHVHGTLLPLGLFLVSSVYRSETLSYESHTLKSYVEFDDLLRTIQKEGKAFEISTQPIPGGFIEFQAIFEEDEHGKFGFAAVDPVTGLITPGPRPPPPRELIIPSLLHNVSDEDLYKLSCEERELLNQLLADAAERESHRMRVSKRKFQGHESRRNVKSREEKFALDMKKVASAVNTTNATLSLLEDIPEITADLTPSSTPPAAANIPLLNVTAPIITVSSAATTPAQSGSNTVAPAISPAPRVDLDVTMKPADGSVEA